MITLQELNTLLHHLHKASEIFDTEATIEEMKHKNVGKLVALDKRTLHAPRNVILHQKAEKVSLLEKELIKECDAINLALKEDVVYSARELVTESAYPWINRREPPLHYMEELLADSTFIPLSHHLTEKRRGILASSISILALPKELEELLKQKHSANKGDDHDSHITVEQIVTLREENLEELLSTLPNKEYAHTLLRFRLYVLGVTE